MSELLENLKNADPYADPDHVCDLIVEVVDGFEQLNAEIARLREALRHAYDDCLKAVAKIKADQFTEAGSNHKGQFVDISAKDWMVAFAEDVEREIKARAALAGEEKD